MTTRLVPPRRSEAFATLVHVVIPLILGGAIYLLWRGPSLLMFKWLSVAGVGRSVNYVRTIVTSSAMSLPQWMIFSLPDALWVYALTSYLRRVWSGSASRGRFIWIACGPAIGIGSELAQAVKIMPGTFDISDLVSCAAASFLALAV